MASRSRYLTASGGDYVLERGAPRPDVTVASDVVLALRTRRGSAAGAPGFGSRLRTLRKLTPAARRLAESYALEAIQHLVDRGEVRGPRFEISIAGPAMRMVVTYRSAAGQPQSVPVTVPLV